MKISYELDNAILDQRITLTAENALEQQVILKWLIEMACHPGALEDVLTKAMNDWGQS
jgi:hypothetical protein